MTARGGWLRVCLAGALALAACRDAPPPPGQAPPAAPHADTAAVSVLLRLPAGPAWNQDDSLRLTVRNAGRAPLADAQLVLRLPRGVQPRADSGVAGRPVLDSTARERILVYSLPQLPAGGSLEFWQRLRTPPAPVAAPPAPLPAGRPAARTPAARPDTSTRLPVSVVITVGADTLALAGDTLRVRPGSEVTIGGCGNAAELVVARYGIGPVRVGMSEEALRMACPEARDSSWKDAEGMRQRGLLVLPGGVPALVVIANGKVARILVDRAGARTAAGAGVGASVGELRDLYGRLCSGRGEGGVAVWFPNAPGVSFGLDSAATRGWSPGHAVPDSIPEEVKVTSLWVRVGSDDCPAGPGESTR